MKKLEVTHQNGRAYLNEVIVQYNNLEVELDKFNSIFKSRGIHIYNIAKVIRNKCVDVHYIFENITYNGNNSLKEEIFKLFSKKMNDGSELLHVILPDIVEMESFDKFSDKRKEELNERIKEYEKICYYIEDYDLKKELKELMNVRYNRIIPQEVSPKTFLKLYETDVVTIKELGLYEDYKNYENEIFELVNKKEIECDNYWLQTCKDKLLLLKSILNVTETLTK